MLPNTEKSITSGTLVARLSKKPKRKYDNGTAETARKQAEQEKQTRAREKQMATQLVQGLADMYRTGGLKEAERDKRLQAMLEEHGASLEGYIAAYKLGSEYTVDPVRVQAAKAALPYLRPQLQSIEATIIDERDRGDPEKVMAQIRALLEAHPDLVRIITQQKNGLIIDAEMPASMPALTEGACLEDDHGSGDAYPSQEE